MSQVLTSAVREFHVFAPLKKTLCLYFSYFGIIVLDNTTSLVQVCTF